MSRILKNHVANLVREKYSQKSCNLGIVYDFDWQNLESANCAEGMVNAADINSFIAKNLPKRLQETFETLKYNDVKTAAKLLGKSCSAVYTNIAKIRVLMADLKAERSKK